jgi:hypothetical protein
MTIVATMSATSVNAVGHVTRPEFADFNIGRLTLCVERFFQALIEQENDQEQELEETGRRLSAKKYRPPHQIGVKGGCSPQNNLQKL